MADNVLLERKGRIATVTLSRPDRRNSLSDEMLGDLVTAFSALRDDDSTRVVIVTGAPPIFSAGADAPFKRGMSEEERRRMFTSRKSQFRRLFERANVLLENLEQVTVGAINGHAVGGGWGLARACGFRVAAAAARSWVPPRWIAGCRSAWPRRHASCGCSGQRAPKKSSSAADATPPRSA